MPTCLRWMTTSTACPPAQRTALARVRAVVRSVAPDAEGGISYGMPAFLYVGEESLSTFTGRTSVATAELFGQHATVFPSHHGGFLGGEFGHAGQPEAFARQLRDSSTGRPIGGIGVDLGNGVSVPRVHRDAPTP